MRVTGDLVVGEIVVGRLDFGDALVGNADVGLRLGIFVVGNEVGNLVLRGDGVIPGLVGVAVPDGTNVGMFVGGKLARRRNGILHQLRGFAWTQRGLLLVSKKNKISKMSDERPFLEQSKKIKREVSILPVVAHCANLPAWQGGKAMGAVRQW